MSDGNSDPEKPYAPSHVPAYVMYLPTLLHEARGDQGFLIFYVSNSAVTNRSNCIFTYKIVDPFAF